MYAVISLIPVVILGVVLAASYRNEARQRGVAEGRSEALLVAETAIEPILDGRSLGSGLSTSERASLQHLADTAVGSRDLLRLRLRDLAGNVVFSDDGSGFKERPEDEALEAAQGSVVARLTRLNSDSVDSGRVGQDAVEVYLPLRGGSPPRRVGVLEVYLPYAPIDADVSAGLHALYRNLAIGLAMLWLALFGISMSVSRRLRRQVKLNKYIAEHDPLTDLPNRTAFHRRAELVLRSARRNRTTVTIAIVDLDRFKEVNDTLGHQNGDHLLTELALRLAGYIRGQDSVARLGGDEFGVILRDAADPAEVLWRIRAVLEHEVSISGLPLTVDASIGYVTGPDDGTDVDELLQRADVAMYVAKARHLGVVRYDPEHDHYDAANLALVAQLRQAIEADDLVLHYQPKATLVDGRVEAVEALVRWQHPVQGLLPPDRFVPLAEQTDLIDRLTEWVLVRALTDLGGLAPEDSELTVAVNVSARNLGNPGLARLVARALEEAGIPADRLVIEITETALMADPERAAAVLGEISELGVLISVDDFGCGQTSLGYLSTLPVDELKIDGSFVADMFDNPSHAAIVRSIVDLGHNLGLRVVGEGVETERALASLRATSCDLAQGYFLARPMPASQLHAWLAAQQAPEPSARV